MHDLVVIVPSRGRPEAAAELAQAFADTCTAATYLMFVVGECDPTRSDYETIAGGSVGVWVAPPCDRPSTMNGNLNAAALALTDGAWWWDVVGFMGDDHRPRTRGWDAAYLAALHDLGTGFVYGDDLLQGERLPTQWAMTADIVRALGYMTPPALWHMYTDNYVRDLGQGAGCLRYLPDVVVEHLHPLAGKALVDDSYRRSNSAEVYDHDGATYREYVDRGDLARDVAKVTALRAGLAVTR